MILLEVAVAAPLRQTLTYGLPRTLQNPSGSGSNQGLAGRRVLVPLAGRRLTGYVLGEVTEHEVDFTVRDIVDFLDSYPIFPENLIPLFRWVAAYYHYPIGEVIKTALPGGLTPQSVRCIELPADGSDRLLMETAGDPPAWAGKLLDAGKLSSAATRKLLANSKQRKQIERLIDCGAIEMRESLTKDGVREKLETCYVASEGLPEIPDTPSPDQHTFQSYREHISQVNDISLKLSEAKSLYYLKLLGKGGKQINAVPRRELIKSYSGAGNALPSLISCGLVEEKKHRVFRSPFGEQLEFFSPPENLTQAQYDVLAEIAAAIEHGAKESEEKFRPFLLHGVTGSGKTEVYLRATKKALQAGRDVLVIVPEIALATQLEAHFVSRFGNAVVLLHSGLSSPERFDQWYLALSGAAKIVIGARSAVFAPLQNPGLIIVDEEHDSGLKQDDSLRYNGRDLAVVRAKMQNCVVLLASATPSVTSYHNGMTGKYRLLKMDKRVGERNMPKVTIIDLRKVIPGQKKTMFRPQLQEALERTLLAGNQSVILLNRRGFSASIICQQCGAPAKCTKCNVSLTMHQSRQQLLCHYCGYAVPSQTVCESCGSFTMVPIGFGTERVEEELNKILPEAHIARLDADTAADRKVFLKTLKSMRNGEIDILVGTQMVAKGHHFPGVTLVGVVFADGGLSMPDYRAAEKTFQLITQVTGRAGRGDVPGEVYIQTLRPEHYAIEFARQHQFDEMVEKELELRQNPLFPPFVRLIAVHLQGPTEKTVSSSAARIAAACRALPIETREDAEVLGPAPAPIDKIKNRFRWQVLLKGKSTGALHRICNYISDNEKALTSGSCRVLIDVDPENLL